jgi:ABC-type transport system involved in Fe-S cluster assembly fused permease/ATPase subunit
MEVSPRSSQTVNFLFIFENRTQFRREANQADNKAASVAVDSLINFEAVKVRKRLPSFTL